VRHLLERIGGFLPPLVALTLPVVFLPIASDSYVLPRASIVIAGACLGLGLAILMTERPSLGALRMPLVAAAAAAALAFAFSISWPLSAAGSYARYESLPVRLAYIGLAASTYWLLRTGRQRGLVGAAFVFGTTVVAFKAWLQWFANVPFRPDGDVGNANLLAGLIVMAIPIAIDRGRRGTPLAAAWALAIVVLLAGLIVTTSRSGALGVIAGALVAITFSVPQRHLRAVAAVSVAGVAAAVVFIVASPLRSLNDDPPELRLHLWQDALRMIAARPLTGWGEDTTGLAFGQFLSRDYAGLVTFDRVHSGVLEIAATQGLLGLAALGWVVAVLARAGWQARAEPGVPGLAGALAGYGVWVFFNFDWAPATGAFWLLAGTLWSSLPRSPGEVAPSLPRSPGELASLPRSPGKVASLPRSPGEVAERAAPGRRGANGWRTPLAATLVVLAMVLAAFPVLADVWYLKGRADLAVRVDPLQAQYHWALGQGMVAQGNLRDGIAELQRAADLGETDPRLYVELGDREAQLGDRAAATRAYRRALEIDPYFSPARQRLATLG
jgi:O-antigen ligase